MNIILVHMTFPSFGAYVISGPVPRKDMATPPPSVLLPFSWKIRNVLNWMKNQCFDFSNFYFSSYRENWTFLVQKWPKLSITRKVKIGKIWIMIFHSIQHILHLLCKDSHFRGVGEGGLHTLLCDWAQDPEVSFPACKLHLERLLK